jgi:O-antigen/teichoic acid export membrane protein
MGSAVIRFYPVYESRSSSKVFFATMSASVGTIVTIVAGLSLSIVLASKGSLPSWLVHLLPVVVLIFVAQSICSSFLGVIRAQKRAGLYTSFQLIMAYGSFGLGLFFVVVFRLGVEGLLWGNFLCLAVMSPVLVLLTTKGAGIHLRYFRLDAAVQIWQYAWPLSLGAVAMWGLRVSDLFIIGALWPARDVGLYSVSYNISAKSIELLVALFMVSVSPLIYRTWETEGREATEATLTMITRIYLILCLPAAVGLSVLAVPFVGLLAAPEYHEGSRIVGLVVFSSFIWGLAHMAVMGLTIRRRAWRLGTNQIAAAAIHIGLQLLFVPRFGYVASAACTLIGYTALLLLQASASRQYLAWRFPFNTLRNVMVASVVMGFAAWGTYRLAGVGEISPAYLFLSVSVALPTYAICLWWLGEVDEAEKKTAVALWDRVTAR